MSIPIDQFVQQIHDSPLRLVLAASGGGSRAIADLLEVPGASRTLLEAFVPYSNLAMINYIGSPPDEFCSQRTARAMAMAAFLQARILGLKDASSVAVSRQNLPISAVTQGNVNNLAGIACTAGLVTDRPRRGSHRIHIAMQTSDSTTTWSLELIKDRRSRAEEERVAGRMLLNAVAETCAITNQLDLDLLEGERPEQSRIEAPKSWQDLLLEKVEWISHAKSIPENPIILSGAFNPLHEGHRRIAQVAVDMLKKPVVMEISILNPDKPPLDYFEIDRRVKQFPPEQLLLLTRAATFKDKARLFQGATFLVGSDTLRRISMDRYYHDDPAVCRRCLEYIASRGCRFIVYGRDMGTGFVRLADLDLPDVLRNISSEIPPEVFRQDISSTGIRKSGKW